MNINKKPFSWGSEKGFVRIFNNNSNNSHSPWLCKRRINSPRIFSVINCFIFLCLVVSHCKSRSFYVKAKEIIK